jgi:hypothetical protein
LHGLDTGILALAAPQPHAGPEHLDVHVGIAGHHVGITEVLALVVDMDGAQGLGHHVQPRQLLSQPWGQAF